ncbi:hypothetical protein JVU11DRAFT_788 [Chiua virens]|nr:hypothetical protein JVU11DRAFT_788 [Chiua virens]
MLLSRVPRPFPIPHRRHFVSTLLLSRTWENETVIELRKEAKARGLSTKGNKSTLIARVKEHDENSVTTISPSIRTPDMTRSASTNVVPPKKVLQATSPGIPLAAQPDSASTRSDFLAIKLPDLSHPPPKAPVQIPYVPDFWDSACPSAPLEPDLPKLHVVGGSVTHYGGGPTHHLENPEDSPSTAVQADRPSNEEVRLRADFWQSLGLTRPFSVRRTLPEARNSAPQTGQDDFRASSRPLTDEERKGLYFLLGIIGGSWLIGGFVNRTSDVAEEHGTGN